MAISLKAREEHLIAQQRLLNERIRWLNDQQTTLAAQVTDLNSQKAAQTAREGQVKVLASEVEGLTERLQEKMSQKAQRNLNLLKRVDARHLAEERLNTLQMKVAAIEHDVEAKRKECEKMGKGTEDTRIEGLERELRKTRDSIAHLEAKSEEWADMLDTLVKKEGSSASKLKVSLSMKEFELKQNETKLQTHLNAAKEKTSKLLDEETILKQEKAKVAGMMRQLRHQRLDLDQKSAELESLDRTLTQATQATQASIESLKIRLLTQPRVEEEDKSDLDLLKERLKKLDERDSAMEAKLESARMKNAELNARFNLLSEQETGVTARRNDLARLEMEIKRREFALNAKGDIEGELDLRLQGLLLSEAVRQKRYSEELRALRELASVASTKERNLKARMGQDQP